MSTATDVHAEHAVDAHGHGDAHEHKPDSFYVMIFAFLVVVTGAEVAWSYAGQKGLVFLLPLLGMMALKFVVVVLHFMHLRTDSKWFNMAFWSGLALAACVYVAALGTFHFFEGFAK